MTASWSRSSPASCFFERACRSRQTRSMCTTRSRPTTRPDEPWSISAYTPWTRSGCSRRTWSDGTEVGSHTTGMSFGASPNREFLGFRERPFAGPGAPLMLELSKDTRCKLTHALLQASNDLDPWTFCHRTQSRYPERSVDHPIAWLVKRRGLLHTSAG